jgi:RNA polymerase sigma factor for flagellar operon FliA
MSPPREANLEAINQSALVDDHLGLVWTIAVQIKRQLSPRTDLRELVAYGTLGLIDAAQKYDGRAAVTFATYAYHRVRGAIWDGVRQMSPVGRAEYRRVKARQRALEQRTLKGYTDEQGDKALEKDTVKFEPLVEDPLADDALLDDALALRQAYARLGRAIAKLPAKERHFIVKHYLEGMTLTDAARAVGLSKSWASRVHARALVALRADMAECGA